MRAAWTIAWRDLRSAFETPLAGVLIAVFLLVSGMLFGHWLESFSEVSAHARLRATQDPRVLESFDVDAAVVRPTLSALAMLLLVFVPVLTMRSLAHDRRLGTLELLMTAPVSTGQLVLGKLLGGVLLALSPIALSLWFPIVLLGVATPDPAVLVGGYAGLVFVTAAFTSVGVLASAIADGPALAALLTAAALVVSTLAGAVGDGLSTNLGAVLAWFSVLRHFDALASGVVDTADLAFFACFTVSTSWLAVRVLEARHR